MVARHSKLRALFFDGEVGQILLRGELVTEAESVIKQSEADNNIAIIFRLFERYSHFVIMIANAAFFAPNGLPSFIESGGFGLSQAEARH